MDTKKVEMEEVTETVEVEVINETKKEKFGTKLVNGIRKHWKKASMFVLGCVGLGVSIVLMEHMKARRAAEEAEEDAERAELAEEWYSRGLEDGQSNLPESTEESKTPAEEV